MSASAQQKVSFTVRRPTPVSRGTSSGPESEGSSFKVPTLPRHLAANLDSAPGSPLARSTTNSPGPSRGYSGGDDNSSSDEDDALQDELVTGFDKFGVQRLNKQRKTAQAPLVIPALQNRDWRDFARKRRSAAQYVPDSAKAQTGADGSVGGLGTKDAINSGPVLSGLQVREKRIKLEHDNDGGFAMEESKEDVKMEVVEETEDQIALRAILAGTDGDENDGPVVDIIPTPVSETDAYKQDVEELPESASLDDYARVPVSQFGAALLRGMGWKEGMAASRKPGKGLSQPYLPEARPALLGIGAKEREVLDDGNKKRTGTRPEKRYVPVVKKDRDGNIVPDSKDKDRRKREASPKRSGSSAAVSRRSSRSPDRPRRDDRDRERERDRNRDRDREHRRRGDSDKDYGRSERRRERSRDSSSRRRDY